MSDLLLVYSFITQFRMQDGAVVVVFHTQRDERKKQLAQDCSRVPLTYPIGFVWLSGLFPSFFLSFFVHNFRKGLSAYTVLTWLRTHVCCRADSDHLLSLSLAGVPYDF